MDGLRYFLAEATVGEFFEYEIPEIRELGGSVSWYIGDVPEKPPSSFFDAEGLPPGLSFNDQTRVISGTPTKAGRFVLRYTAIGSNFTGDWGLRITVHR